jgi:predicted GH43/DUF377 family glycosyl hydrolase
MYADLLRRQTLELRPDPSRVAIRPFKPTIEPRDHNPTDRNRANHIVERVLSMSPNAAAAHLAIVQEHFEDRHRDLMAVFEGRADEMEASLASHSAFTPIQRRLVGAYFLQETSFEAAALFNPSIIAHPDQTAAPDGALQIILSLRAVGEGHISSLTFRSGAIAADGTVSVDPCARLASPPTVSIRHPGQDWESIEVCFRSDEDLSERVIFPVAPSQSNGIEDARFVRFEGETPNTYLATYTAYSGRSIRSELITTNDCRTFEMQPMKGAATQNKGMALFPRRIGGQYAMVARQDNENLYLLYSNDLTTWEGGVPILKPLFPWEFVQIGNCGSPIELDEGWLLLTHGVGPVRKYAIGAALLDKADPSQVLARLPEPLISPGPAEREGYVPNVVYTCGAMRHGANIVLPYAVSDTFCTFATIDTQALLTAMRG